MKKIKKKVVAKVVDFPDFDIYLQKQVNLEHKTQHAVITHANTYNGIKIPTFFLKESGDDVELVQCPFNNYVDMMIE